MKLFKMLFKKECSHPFWSQPDVNNIQYCVQCNYGRKVLEDGDCNHKWKHDDFYHVSTCVRCGKRECFHEWMSYREINVDRSDGTNEIIYLLKCLRCGELKEKKIGD